jgi:hypothetical protein
MPSSPPRLEAIEKLAADLQRRESELVSQKSELDRNNAKRVAELLRVANEQLGHNTAAREAELKRREDAIAVREKAVVREEARVEQLKIEFAAVLGSVRP